MFAEKKINVFDKQFGIIPIKYEAEGWEKHSVLFPTGDARYESSLKLKSRYPLSAVKPMGKRERRRRMVEQKNKYTTAFGIPVAEDQNSLTAGERGPVLIQDVHLLEKLSHFDRERIPERVVHAKGAGAYGYFEVTADVTNYTKAKFLSKVGKKTDVFVRFSTVGGEKGSPDAARDPRGFAVKFYTEDGNYDLVGNNTPVFFIRDPLKFPDFIHTQKKNPATNLPDPDMFWDFLSLTSESIHQVTILFSDRGTPATYRNMNGYSSHTFKWYNDKGEYFWCSTISRPIRGL